MRLEIAFDSHCVSGVVAVKEEEFAVVEFHKKFHVLIRKIPKEATNMEQSGNGQDVMSLAAELAHAVDVIMNPSTSQQSRMEAYVACEK